MAQLGGTGSQGVGMSTRIRLGLALALAAFLYGATVAGADPLTLQVVQLSPMSITTTEIGPVFYSTSQWFTLFADVHTPLSAPSTITVEAPLATYTGEYPALVDGITTGFWIARVYHPTRFTVRANLVGVGQAQTSF